MKSSLSLSSNLMIDDEEHRPEYRYLPGDYVGAIYPHLVDVRVAKDELTQRQLIELKQYLVCVYCRRPCAGTCEIGRRKRRVQ